jgi:dihydrofolate synthase/folylpolyglutamate synthase
MADAGWDAERYLLSLELFGMRFGLDRMRLLLGALGSPQDRFASIHVVGTNGKSSTTRMIAAILQHHGVRAGAYLSPHLVSFTERIRITGTDLGAGAFSAAVARVAAAADTVNAQLEHGDRVTQFEALTAVAYDELARAGVEVAVVEAGLGGRYDATNVIGSRVQVLTSVGIEHTRWLGTTIAKIAAEKLDVVKPGGTLVVGADLHPDALWLARAVTADRGARLVQAPDDPGAVTLAARGAFQQRNFAVARAAAQAFLGTLDEEAVRAAAATTVVPGRFEVISERPMTVFDGAHNPAGLTALAETLPAFAADRRLVAVVSVLDDKEIDAMLRVVLGFCEAVVFTTSGNPRAVPGEKLATAARRLGGQREIHQEDDPHAALGLARDLAGADGVVLATGSIYLIADLLRGPDAGPAATL